MNGAQKIISTLVTEGVEVAPAEFTRLGLLTVPVAMLLSVLALYGGLHIIGG